MRPSRWRVLVAVLLLVAACGGEGPDPPGEEGSPGPAADSPAAAVRPTTIGSVLGGPAEGAECIRGGTPRADVRALMGEPDSISFGVWIYGESTISFGYGVVVEYTDPDGGLALCEDAR